MPPTIPTGTPILARGRAVVGIDIGKRKHAAAAVSPQGQVLARIAAFSNDRAGIEQLEREVLAKTAGPGGKTLVAMEATGHYWLPLYHELQRRGYACVVLNPIQTNARSGVRIRKTKTDYIETVDGQIDGIENDLEIRVASIDSPLPSLGIRSVLAATIHAESDPISDFRGPDQYVAYAGFDPSVRESGDTIHGRSKISKRGSPTLRRALYLSAFAVYQKHDYFHRIYHKHRKKGRGHTSGLVVVAHKLARVIWRMLTDNRKFTKRPPKKKIVRFRQDGVD